MARATLSDADRAALKEEMRTLMIEAARARETMTYAELCMRLQTARVHYHSSFLVHMLDEIGREEMAAGRGALPAVVVRKDSGIPGGGYFRETAHPDHDPDELEAWWRQDLDALYAYWDGQRDE